MKKLLYLLPALALFGCESESEGQQTCDNWLWNLTETCSPDPDTGEIHCNWLATYGLTQATATTVQVNESTYDHYIGQGTVTNGSICWDGTH